MTRTFLIVLGACVATVGCSKSEPPLPIEKPSASAVANMAAAASATTVDASTETSWAGHYTATPGPFYVPDGGEWSGVRFRGEDASVGLGDGTMQVTIDGAKRVSGTIEGPLGPLRMNGELGTKELTALLVSAEPGKGFTGTAVGTVDGDHVTGTMRLALPTGNVIRLAQFTLDKKH